MLCLWHSRNTRLYHSICPWFFITLGELQAHGDTAESVPCLETEFSRRPFRPNEFAQRLGRLKSA